MPIRLRAATPEDVPHVARLADIAAEGSVSAFWEGLARPGQDPMDVGEARCAIADDTFSWSHSVLATDDDGEVAGIMIGHDIADIPREIDEEVHPMFRPIVRLTHVAEGAQTVNIISVYPKYRRRGIATKLLRHAEKTHGRAALIMSDANIDGRAFCSRCDYMTVGEVPVVKGSWSTPAKNWRLMRKAQA